jgi:hypothetical protein
MSAAQFSLKRIERIERIQANASHAATPRLQLRLSALRCRIEPY